MPRPSMKDAILQHGCRVIHERGYHGAGIADIAAAAGVPKGSFYNHFPSKEAFAQAALDYFFDAFQPVFDTVLDNTALSGRERVEGFVAGLVRGVSDSGFHGCLLGNMALDAAGENEALRAAINRRFAVWQRHIGAAVAAGQADGSLSDRLPADLAAGWILSAFEGAALRSRAERGPRALEEFQSAAGALLEP